MGKVRVLIVDDSVVMRRLVSQSLSGDPALEVVGTAANGRIALAKISQVTPDIVTLDVEMPVMDGLETLREIRKAYPRLPVIMFSSLTKRGALATLDALTLGATDYVTKPSNSASYEDSKQYIAENLVPKIKGLYPTGTRGRATEFAPPRPDAPMVGRLVSPPPIRPRVDVVSIGISTGGPTALIKMLPALPAHFPVPTLIVQHMPPLFTRLLSERLASKCRIRVSEGISKAEIRPSQVWLAPGNFHMSVEKNDTGIRIRTHLGQRENSCRPAVDVLFRSVAKVYGPHVLALVMTGMGCDGLRGCEAIREAGGSVWVQDEASSVVWGMPGFVHKAGLAERVLPLERLGPEVIRRVLGDRAESDS